MQGTEPEADDISTRLVARYVGAYEVAGVSIEPKGRGPAVGFEIQVAADGVGVDTKFGNVRHTVRVRDSESFAFCYARHEFGAAPLGVVPSQARRRVWMKRETFQHVGVRSIGE